MRGILHGQAEGHLVTRLRSKSHTSGTSSGAVYGTYQVKNNWHFRPIKLDIGLSALGAVLPPRVYYVVLLADNVHEHLYFAVPWGFLGACRYVRRGARALPKIFDGTQAVSL